MSAVSYSSLALRWVPDSHETRPFYIITGVVLVVALLLALFVSSIPVPPKERTKKAEVPERVAKFISEKKKVTPPTPAPTPIPTPKVIPTPKPKVARKPEKEERKPLTKEEKKARDKASQSGLLALTSELADLMDTSSVDSMVGAKTKKTSRNAMQTASVDSDILTSGANKGSGGVSTSDYVQTGVGSTTLSERDVALVKQSLVKSDQVEKDEDERAARSGKVRTEEEVTIVFDQNKGQLFSLYNRERRKQPGLKGKLVLDITIAPDGTVTKVVVASSELNHPALEKRIIARVKRFRFEAKDVAPVTVTFPIEFLPS